MHFYKKYKWLLPSLLFTCGLIGCRFVVTESFAFLFIIWNMLLGAMPLYFAYKLSRVSTRLLQALCFIGWLLFFPNSMYIVTDLFHLTSRPGVPKWYDLLIFFSAALNGVIMGFVSLAQVERYLRKALGDRHMSIITFGFFMLCGYGVYLGRYMRWNSWDVLTQPSLLAADCLRSVLHPWQHAQCWLLTILFGGWMWLLYGYFRRMKVIMPQQ